jgi:diguanylate cyclase
VLWSRAAFAQPQLEVAHLPDERVSFDEILRLPSERWTPVHNANLSLGFTHQAHWLRVNISPLRTPQLLLLEYPHLDYVRFYQARDGQLVRQISTGDRLPFSMRPVAHRNFVFPIEASAEPQTLYLWVDTRGLLQVPLHLLSPEALAQSDQHYLLIQGLYYGFFLAASIFALFLWATHRDSTYGLFGVLMLGYAVVEGLYSGLVFAYLWPSLPAFNALAMPVSLALAIALAARFAQRCFRITPGQRGYYACQGVFWCALMLLAASPLLPLAVALQAGLVLLVLHSVIHSGLGVYWMLCGRSGSGLYFAAWVSFLVGTLAMLLYSWGALPDSTSAYGLNQGASLVQVVLLTFMVCSRVKRDYTVRLADEFAARTQQEKAIEQEQAQAQRLAQAVNEKTAALQAALNEVSKLNLELSKETITDSLTGLFNRRHFDHILDSEVRRAAREHRPISLVLIDVDHFKKINDTYGHAVGDDCLIQLARLLRHVVRQPPDIVFRSGGEEMALLLPGSDAAGAKVVAEKICNLVAASEFCYPAGCLQLTLSLGVGSLIPAQNTLPRAVFELADEALYLAKNGGRNRVACLTQADPLLVE